MTKREDVYGYINEVASRAESGQHADPTHQPIPDLDQPASSLVDPYLSKAERYAFMGRHLPDGTRFRRVKELLLRATRMITEDQVEFNQTVLGALKVANIDAYGRLAGVQMLVASVELAVQEAIDELEQARRDLVVLRGKQVPVVSAGKDEVSSRHLPQPSEFALDDLVADLVGSVLTKGRALVLSGGAVLEPLMEAEGFPATMESDLAKITPGSLAAVVVLDCIEVMSDVEIESILSTSRRGLGSGGTFIVRALDPDNLLTLSRLALMSSDARAIHPTRLASMVTASGFHDVQVRPTDADPEGSGLNHQIHLRKMFGPRRFILRGTNPG